MLLSSCAKTKYLWEQGWGHFDIYWSKPKKNSEVLKDPNISEEIKNKITDIENYKAYFYQYFKKKPSANYSKTVFLDEDVLTYLVIVSPHDVVKAKEFSFPFYGSFPYLGFYKKESAENFIKSMHEQDYVTHMRKVDAYSTLGKMEDPIFSTFFKYDEYDLAKLIFHELFHSIFFIKDDVELNENMANYFADQMVLEYFKLSPEKLAVEKLAQEKEIRLKQEIVFYAKELNRNYAMARFNLTKIDSDMILEQFLRSRFNPGMKQLCKELKLKKDECFPLRYLWNNATFASFITYERNRYEIEDVHKKVQGNLLDFYQFLEKNYEIYNSNDYEEHLKFSEFIFRKVE